ncbi:hypothetical protein [Trabulsiella odontotermitis]|uniref:Uncharacterized protein n=1 Tax=Trabulsiella odontotermitis TaxID=379893 RepID=A0A0L0GV46_9ENTR|nr:hypothetical protein [Trabulsiella odontotermitis]KNC92303.1 hypothetical protein GM31_23685 [Trabulsiella odontotermitis]
MSDETKLFAAAIMANKNAWSSLVGVLAAQGAIDIRKLSNDLKRVQNAHYDNGQHELAEALDLHLHALEGWHQQGY